MVDYSELYVECQQHLKVVQDAARNKNYDEAATAAAELIEAARLMKMLLLKIGS